MIRAGAIDVAVGRGVQVRIEVVAFAGQAGAGVGGEADAQCLEQRARAGPAEEAQEAAAVGPVEAHVQEAVGGGGRSGFAGETIENGFIGNARGAKNYGSGSNRGTTGSRSEDGASANFYRID